MSSFILFIAFMTGVTVTFVIFSYEFCHILKAESANRVHFYVARDESGELYLYLGKPIRRREAFYTDDKSVIIPFSSRYLKKKLVLTKKISKALNGKMSLLRYS